MDVDRVIAQAAGEGPDRPSDPLVRMISNERAWIPALRETCARFEINTPNRIAMFLANCAHESAAFSRLRENMHYSAARLLAVFPRYFTPDLAMKLAYDDKAIAEVCYGGRMGNDAQGCGDGWMYRGGGLLGATGRGMYAKCGKAIGVDLESVPALIEQPVFAALSAGYIWAEEKLCNQLADDAKFQSIVLRINGGLNGFDERLDWLTRLRAV